MRFFCGLICETLPDAALLSRRRQEGIISFSYSFVWTNFPVVSTSSSSHIPGVCNHLFQN